MPSQAAGRCTVAAWRVVTIHSDQISTVTTAAMTPVAICRRGSVGSIGIRAFMVLPHWLEQVQTYAAARGISLRRLRN